MLYIFFTYFFDIFQNAIAFEEQEESRFNRKHFKDCLADLTKVVQDVKTLKSSSSDEVNIFEIQ